EGAETTYYFEYATDQFFVANAGQYNKKSEPPATIPANEAGVTPLAAGPATLSPLEAGTVYHYRLVAVNAGGTTLGTDQTFATTAPKLATVGGENAQVTSQMTALVSGEINTQGLQTTYVFELGADTSYGTPVFGTINSGEEGPTQLAFQLSSLLPGTTYHYRLVAINEDGTVPGADHEFTTPGFPPVIIPPASTPLVPFSLPPEVKPPPAGGETRAEKYKHAVKLCKKKSKSKRAACMRKAKRQFGPVKKKGKKK
ncbi:MAG TPA: hypothetical protein VID70_03435, partial [Solirubrobacteraceae bacterium]